MQVPLSPAIRFDIQSLANTISQCQSSDALQCRFSPPHWDILAGYLQPFPMTTGQVLMEQGAHDRNLYFIEQGALSAHHENQNAQSQMASVAEGTVLGEGAFFTNQPRRATVHASSECKLWSLTPNRFRDLAHKHGQIALELTLALGSVMARRQSIEPKQAAIT